MARLAFEFGNSRLGRIYFSRESDTPSFLHRRTLLISVQHFFVDSDSVARREHINPKTSGRSPPVTPRIPLITYGGQPRVRLERFS
jgi:hypothetical protein